MRLPDPLYAKVKRLCAHHARWHDARLPANAPSRGPGTEFPGLMALDEPGSGEQFLEYHRGMLTAFFEAVASGSDARWALDRWERFPSWLADYFAWAEPGFLRGALARTEEIIRTGTADDLGNFLESTLVSEDPFRGIHNLAHAHIAAYEEHRFGADHPFLRDAGMGSPETSPHNEHFWSLHAWIDGLYSRLLRRRSVVGESGTASAVRR
jgi:hypothetical protein